MLLQEFAACLACKMGSSRIVESNYSILKQTKSDQRMHLSNYALEGQMQCKQDKQLVNLCSDLNYNKIDFNVILCVSILAEKMSLF